jgi:hypothetical protein
MLVSGVGMVYTARIDILRTPWLTVGIVLYLVAMGIGVGILLPTIGKAVRMAEGMAAKMAAGGPPGGPSVAPVGPGAAPAGPPPEFMALISRARIAGTVNQVLVLVILFLMVIKPGGVATA